MPMPALQDIIHKIELGEWTRYVKGGVILLAFLAFTVLYDFRQYKNFSSQEAMDCAQLARNIAQGRGFTTDFVRPLSFYLLQRHFIETKQPSDGILKRDHPDLANPPVYPLLLAGWMKILPFHYDIPKGVSFSRYQPEVLIACLNQVLFFSAILLVFCLALKLFDVPVAWLAAVVFAGTDLFWRFTVSGLSTIFLVVLFLGLVWCLVLIEERSRDTAAPQAAWRFIALAAAAGGLVGVGALTRYAFFWLLIPVVLFFILFLGQRRTAASAAAVAACAVLVIPWLVRNYNISGTILGTTGYGIYQQADPASLNSNKLERYMSNDFELALNKVGVNHFLRKLMVNSADIVRHNLVDLGGNWVSAFFLV